MEDQRDFYEETVQGLNFILALVSFLVLGTRSIFCARYFLQYGEVRCRIVFLGLGIGLFGIDGFFGMRWFGRNEVYFWEYVGCFRNDSRM